MRTVSLGLSVQFIVEVVDESPESGKNRGTVRGVPSSAYNLIWAFTG
jgi:hypothetical protein